jgi:hypothetical protein
VHLRAAMEEEEQLAQQLALSQHQQAQVLALLTSGSLAEADARGFEALLVSHALLGLVTRWPGGRLRGPPRSCPPQHQLEQTIILLEERLTQLKKVRYIGSKCAN